MKRLYRTLSSLMVFFSLLLSTQTACAQGFGAPLTIQGLDHITFHSAASRAAGGISVGVHDDISVMFSNPASLQSLKEMQASVGGLQQYSDAKQIQQYGPLAYYSNFSLLMEGLTGYISNPDTTKPGVRYLTTADTVQRPFDHIGTNWTRSRSNSFPLQVFVAKPFSAGDIKFSAGLGMVEYANLNFYFQNKNVLSPSILSVNPATTVVPKNDSVPPIPVQWFQSYQQRDGSINGYGGALSVSLFEKLSLGVSGMILKGSTDDKEVILGRGNIKFYSKFIKVDSIYYQQTKSGTSDYSGQELTFSGSYKSRYVEIGFSAKPPTTITRKYTTKIQTDTTGSSTLRSLTGQDKITIPWRGMVGLSIALREDLTLGFEYEIRPYASAEYKKTGSLTTNPWLTSNLFHLGAEYNPLPWLVLRAGVREQAEIFEPVGNPLPGEPVSYTVYSCGGGVKLMGVRVNLAYEYYSMKYDDMWASAVSINTEIRNNFTADIAYDIPW